MAKLGKPKGSHNKRTLERLAITAARPALGSSQSDDAGSLQQTHPANNVQCQNFEPYAAFHTDELPATLHPGYYTAQGSPSTGPMTRDLWSIPTDFHDHQKHFAGTATLNPNRMLLAADEHSMGDYVEDWMDKDWQNILGTSLTEIQRPVPPSEPTASSLNETPPSLADTRGSPSPVLGPEYGGCDQTCTCFKKLADHLHDLHVIERQQHIICFDMTLYKTNATLSCAKSVLMCQFSRLDSKVLLLVMTVLQTMLNWVRMEYSQQGGTSPQGLPAINFGNWKVPDTDAHLIKDMLTSRILTAYDSIVEILRLRMDEIALRVKSTNLTYQNMDTESLKHTLERLLASLGELMRTVRQPNT